MSAIKRRELKAFLNTLSKDQLIEQIATLCAAVPQAADFYRTKLRAEDDAAVAEEYKKKIRREFARWYGDGFRLSSARQPVTEFEKVAGSAGTVVDVMLTYVEEGLDAVLDIGGLDESYANSMATMYRSAAQAWWQGREERGRERDSLQRTAEELVRDSTALQDVLLPGTAAKLEALAGWRQSFPCLSHRGRASFAAGPVDRRCHVPHLRGNSWKRRGWTSVRWKWTRSTPRR